MTLLTGKSAIITGANRGIGLAIIQTFAAQGANIWACARLESDEFSAEIESIKLIELPFHYFYKVKVQEREP